MDQNKAINQMLNGSRIGQKKYGFNKTHDKNKPAQMWFQESEEGLVLFIVFYTLACRWSRCLGCNLPSMMSDEPVSYRHLMAQIDNIFALPEVVSQKDIIKKVIISNNGSILDEDTFSSTALMYLIANVNIHLSNLSVVTIETRPEYVELAELEFLSRALKEGDPGATLEIAIGFEAFDNHIRNDIFDKGLPLDLFESFVQDLKLYKFRLKCYFMHKPVPAMTNSQAVEDIKAAIDYLSKITMDTGIRINMHLNPTYVAAGTQLESAFLAKKFTPPLLSDVKDAVLHAKGKSISIFVGLSDEGLAVEGGSFIRPGDEKLVSQLEAFNKTQNFELLMGF